MPTDIFHQEILAGPTGEKGKKRKWEEKKENFKGKRWKFETGKGMKMSKGYFLFFSFLFFSRREKNRENWIYPL